MPDAHAESQGTGDKNRGIGAEENADEHRHGKAEQGFSAEAQQRQHREHCRQAGHQCPRHRLVDRVVDQRLRRGGHHLAEIFADAVEDNDRIVDRIPDYGEQRGQDIEIEAPLHQGKQSRRDDHVMQLREHRAKGEFPFEAHRQIDHHSGTRQEQRDNAFFHQLGLILAADLGLTHQNDPWMRALHSADDALHQHVAAHPFFLCETDLHVTGGAVLDDARLWMDGGDFRAHLGNGDRLRIAQFNRRATGKFNSVIEAA